MLVYENDWEKVETERTPEKDKEIADKVFEWFRKAEMYHPESLGQSDHTFLEGPTLIMDLTELIDWNVTYKDEE